MFVKFFVRNFGTGNGCASFMGVWDFWLFLQENPHAHKMPRFKSGYFGFFLGGGWEVPILFLWAREFF